VFAPKAVPAIENYNYTTSIVTEIASINNFIKGTPKGQR
jgi:hypothetical protein